jgi:hypothetical protein
MSDDLIISGSGSTAVATDELFANAAALNGVAGDAAGVLHSIGSIDHILSVHFQSAHYQFAQFASGAQLTASQGPEAVARAIADVELATSLVARVRHKADELSSELIAAAENYGKNEEAAERAMREYSASAAYLGGLLSSALVAVIGPFLPFAVALGTSGQTTIGRWRGEHDGPGLWEKRASELLTNPAIVAMIREAAMSTDDYVGGTLLLPPEVVRALGDQGLGVMGVGTSAGLIVGMGSRAGLLSETPVSITATSTASVVAPHGFAERIDRLPSGANRTDHAQIVVERYSADGVADRFQVYIGGTADFSPRAGNDAFDMTSNMAGMAGLPAGSYVAVQQALADSGVNSSTPVVFTGYSQGGLVASLLASSGDYNTQGIVTIGSPAGQIQLPTDIPAVIIEHTDDLVPALGGTQSNHDAVLVQRQAFGDRPLPEGIAVPAHHFEYYLETAQLLDEARSDQVRNASQTLDAFGSGATTITSTRYYATRDVP